jgi:hypothetical protein
VARIVAEIARFLDSPVGREIAQAARAGLLRREVPFILRLEGDGLPGTYLDGTIDALIAKGDELRIIDYKYALARRGAAERYRFQLAAYALAVTRAYPGAIVRAGLVFLRGDRRELDLTPDAGELGEVARLAPRLAYEAFSGQSGESSPAALGRGLDRCRSEACGFLDRCFPALGR